MSTRTERTLAGFAAELDARRRTAFPGSSLADPFPTTYVKTFVRTVPPGDEVLTYKNGTRCDDKPAAVGTVVIRPGGLLIGARRSSPVMLG